MTKKSSYQVLKDQYIAQGKQLELLANVQDQKVPEKAKVINKIPFVQTLWRITQDISTFKLALLRAENRHAPNRTELYRLFKDVMLDGHISSVIQTRKASILSSEFIVTKGGEEVEALTEMLQKKWFYDFVNLALDSNYFGFSLIEFGDVVDDEFKSIGLVPREYVKPEFDIVGATTAELDGVNYMEKPYSDWTIGVGEKENLGLLTKCAPYFLWKRNAIQAHAEYCEMAGVPIRVFKTSAYDEQTRSLAENFARNLGSSAYAVISKDDEIEFGEARNPQGAAALFSGLMDKMNEELSKLILGGTGMVDSKAFVGSSEIHQENFLLICGQDKIFIQNVCNYQLIPLLNAHGFGFEGCKIEIKADEEINLVEKFAMVSTLLQSYDIAPEWIDETFNIPVTAKAIAAPMAGMGMKPKDKQVPNTGVDNPAKDKSPENNDVLEDINPKENGPTTSSAE
jgi:phage gp29-like protein